MWLQYFVQNMNFGRKFLRPGGSRYMDMCRGTSQHSLTEYIKIGEALIALVHRMYPPREVEVSIRVKVLMFVWFWFLLLVVVGLDLEESTSSPVAWELL